MALLLARVASPSVREAFPSVMVVTLPSVREVLPSVRVVALLKVVLRPVPLPKVTLPSVVRSTETLLSVMVLPTEALLSVSLPRVAGTSRRTRLSRSTSPRPPRPHLCRLG